MDFDEDFSEASRQTQRVETTRLPSHETPYVIDKPLTETLTIKEYGYNTPGSNPKAVPNEQPWYWDYDRKIEKFEAEWGETMSKVHITALGVAAASSALAFEASPLAIHADVAATPSSVREDLTLPDDVPAAWKQVDAPNYWWTKTRSLLTAFLTSHGIWLLLLILLVYLNPFGVVGLTGQVITSLLGIKIPPSLAFLHRVLSAVSFAGIGWGLQALIGKRAASGLFIFGSATSVIFGKTIVVGLFTRLMNYLIDVLENFGDVMRDAKQKLLDLVSAKNFGKVLSGLGSLGFHLMSGTIMSLITPLWQPIKETMATTSKTSVIWGLTKRIFSFIFATGANNPLPRLTYIGLGSNYGYYAYHSAASRFFQSFFLAKSKALKDGYQQNYEALRTSRRGRFLVLNLQRLLFSHFMLHAMSNRSRQQDEPDEITAIEEATALSSLGKTWLLSHDFVKGCLRHLIAPSVIERHYSQNVLLYLILVLRVIHEHRAKNKDNEDFLLELKTQLLETLFPKSPRLQGRVDKQIPRATFQFATAYIYPLIDDPIADILNHVDGQEPQSLPKVYLRVKSDCMADEEYFYQQRKRQSGKPLDTWRKFAIQHRFFETLGRVEKQKANAFKKQLDAEADKEDQTVIHVQKPSLNRGKKNRKKKIEKKVAVNSDEGEQEWIDGDELVKQPPQKTYDVILDVPM